MWNLIKGAALVAGSVLGVVDDESDDKLPLHTSQDDGVSNDTYSDGLNAFKRDLTGDLHDPFGSSTDDEL
ncbi:hypothetical protein [Vibrio neptunius]|uniref:Uncharacterized protein n=1 Tax=Vibrio neptunius TaxID=170651 RepID=A0ABS3A4X2_9VIBR|nr:hypothetical protein [Vibrio neptunius]MBN3494745.1 hypothetical protein [Vibrio neptunius]MBN3517109.1 hypothetical protein [Vibrio neptunius]MBN3551213.1 hypothetical protein [Vibrio neptunius]MBN3579505.1 hypothetical protein [Vibrio neptunius]MCH9873170.1 hypothetical protein [Vibrio neptunius]